MAYVPTNWVDLVTDLSAANMNHLETGVDEAHDLAEAAIAKAIIDAKGDIIAGNANDTPVRVAVGANDTVLTADSAVAGGVKWAALPGGAILATIVDAKGDLIAATGADAVSRLAVGANDTVLTADSSLATGLKWAAPASQVIPVGTSLPGSPANGDKAILVDSTTTPTYAWMFQYVASVEDGATDYRWVFIGGSPKNSAVATAQGTASATYAALTTAGPSVVLPSAGIYVVTFGFEAANNTFVADGSGRMSFDIGGTGAVDADSAVVSPSLGASGVHNMIASTSRTVVKTITTAVTLTAKYKVAGGSTIDFSNRWMAVTPVRIA